MVHCTELILIRKGLDMLMGYQFNALLIIFLTFLTRNIWHQIFLFIYWSECVCELIRVCVWVCLLLILQYYWSDQLVWKRQTIKAWTTKALKLYYHLYFLFFICCTWRYIFCTWRYIFCTWQYIFCTWQYKFLHLTIYIFYTWQFVFSYMILCSFILDDIYKHQRHLQFSTE